MPEAETYVFTHKEILELLVKAAKIKTGSWMLQVNFNFTAANIGPDEKSVMPAAVAAIAAIGITKAKPDSPAALVIDASGVNPASSA